MCIYTYIHIHTYRQSLTPAISDVLNLEKKKKKFQMCAKFFLAGLNAQ